MRALGLPIALLCAACDYNVIPSGNSGDDAAMPPGDVGDFDGPSGLPLFRKQITIDRTKVTGTLPQFPVWIVLTDNDLKTRATQAGLDIHFTSGTGAALPFEIQRWMPSMGRLEAWVRVDLTDTADTVIELRYGDPVRSTAESPQMVFASSFAAVWHLDDTLANMTIADATAQRNGMAQGGLVNTDQVPAKLGGGVDFDGNGARIEFSNPFVNGDSAADHTFSAWIYQRTPTNFDSIVTVGTASQNRSRWFHSRYTSSLSAGFYGNDWPDNPSPLPNLATDNWVLLHWVYKASNRQSRIYRDGMEIGAHTFSSTGGGPNTSGTLGYIGYALMQWGAGGNTTCALNGILDEVRLARIDRSAGWIATEFANQDSPQTFYSVAGQERLP
jgi:biopolymer transport protein ExbB